jgi:hypothetical protein
MTEINCPICKQTKPHLAKGLCSQCYSVQRWKNKPQKECVKCGRIMRIAAHGLCMKCYVWPRYKESIYRSMDVYRNKPENKEKRKIYNKKWNKKNPDYYKDYCKWWRAQHGGKAWTKKDPRKKQQK